MSDTPESNNNGAAPAAGATPAPADPSAQPSLSVLAQYLKDLSFENPKAPGSFQNADQPKIEVNVDVSARSLGGDAAPTQYEVELSVAARANRDGEAVFVVEATYGGVFDIRNLPRDQLEMIMLVECPRLMFPFLRQIVADATRNGNFPPLMMEPIDFMGIYQANAERARQQAASTPVA
jgi:preprotein translocase subunit SecB